MAELTVAHAPDGGEPGGTRAGHFLTRRGVLLLKEFRDIGVTVDNYGTKLTIKTFIVSVAKSSTTQPDISYSVSLDQVEDKRQSSALIDYEELEELDKALQYIQKIAIRFSGEQRDYTEVIYCTKDKVNYGFYQQKNSHQMAFINLDNRSSFFMPVKQFEFVRELLKQASDHLESRGAKAIK